MPQPGATATRGTPVRPKDVDRLRRLALDRQGLLKAAPFGKGLGGARRAIERLGYVQIDTISVVSRAHHHVFQVRVPGYAPKALDRLQARGEVFEYWSHAAAYLPMRDYRFALPRMRDMRERRERWVRSSDQALMAEVLERVRQEGPLQTRDFEAPPRADAGWWDWKPAKRALEQLFMQGDLMVSGRAGFRKVYDLPERVLPAWVDTREPTLAEYAAHLVEANLMAHGIASVQACAYQRRTPGLRAALQAELSAREREGTLLRLDLAAPERHVYVEPDAFERRAAPAPATARLLSPFDNAIILRHRGTSLFGFDYQLECYVPEARRRFGYFCLPVLYRDRFIGRVDCKAHRREGRLEVKRVFIEHPEWIGDDPDRAFAALALALNELAAHNGCEAVQLRDVDPGRWRMPLARAIGGAASANGASMPVIDTDEETER